MLFRTVKLSRPCYFCNTTDMHNKNLTRNFFFFFFGGGGGGGTDNGHKILEGHLPQCPVLRPPLRMVYTAACHCVFVAISYVE